MPLLDPLQNLYSTCTCNPNTASISGTPGQLLTDTNTGNVYVYASDADIDAGELAWQLIASPQASPPIPVAGNQTIFATEVNLVAAANDSADVFVQNGRPLVLEGAVVSLKGSAAAVAGADAEIQLQVVTAGVATDIGDPLPIPVGTAGGDAIAYVGLSALTVAERTIPSGSALRALVGGGNTAATPTPAVVSYTTRVS